MGHHVNLLYGIAIQWGMLYYYARYVLDIHESQCFAIDYHCYPAFLHS